VVKIRIALTCSIKPEHIAEKDREKYAEFDSKGTINGLADAIKSNGHEVEIIDVKEDIKDVLKAKKNDIDLVFNVAEGLSGEDRESVVPKICEELGIPFTASGSETLIITLNKAKTKWVLEKNKIATPKSQLFHRGDEELGELRFPLLVKPVLEGSSKGIFNENLVSNESELRKVLVKTIKQYNQPALAEEFLEGREFTVSVIGYDSPVVLPIAEIKFDYLPEGVHHMDSYEVKWIYDNPDSKVDAVVCPAEIDKELEDSIKDIAIRAFKSLDCKDWARIDIRLDRKGIPNVLEVNALPGFMKDPKENSRLPKAAYAAGWSYEELIGRVLNSALSRFKIKIPTANLDKGFL